MKKISKLLALFFCFTCIATEATAAWMPSKTQGEGSGNTSKPSGDSSGNNNSSLSGTRTKYEPSDAAAAVNPDGADNTVTITF